MKRKYFLASSALLLLPVIPAKAICPVCVVAVGAGLGLSEYLGIDDSIAGVWIGGMLISLSAWTINYCEKKKWFSNFRSWRDPLIVIAYYLMVIWPLFSKEFIGNPFNRLYGLDKLAFGIAAGSVVFALAAWAYEIMKKRNNGHAHFPFEKVAMPVGALMLMSLIFYFLTK